MFENNQQFKADFKALIDSAEASDFLAQATALADSHKINLTKDRFVKQLNMLVTANNRSRAKKLVDAIDDKSLSLGGELLFRGTFFSLKWGTVFSIVYLIVRFATS